MADIAPGEDTPPNPLALDTLGADSEISSVPSSHENSNSALPENCNEIEGTAAASTTAVDASGSEDANSAQPVDTNDETATASIAAAESTDSSPNNTNHSSTSTSSSNIPKPPSVIKSRTSFTADSPYFTSFCDGEIKSLGTLSNSLRDISARTNTFCRTGALMSEAMHRLANSCKLRPERNLSQDHPDEERREKEDDVLQRRNAVGEEMAKLLQLLGEVSYSGRWIVS
jgi:Tfp pilus assembly major pilin PilA